MTCSYSCVKSTSLLLWARKSFNFRILTNKERILKISTPELQVFEIQNTKIVEKMYLEYTNYKKYKNLLLKKKLDNCSVNFIT